MPVLRIEKKYLFISVVIHSLLVVLLIWFSDFGSRLYLPVSAVFVDIVQRQRPERKIVRQESEKTEKKTAVKKTKPATKEKVKKPVKKIIPEKEKTPLKKISLKENKKVIPEKKVEKKKPEKKIEPVDVDNGFIKMMESIESVSREVEKERIAERKKAIALRTDREVRGNIEDMRFQLYYDSVWFKIKESWILPDIPEIDEKKLSVIIMLRVRNDGEIIERNFEKKSGNYLFDNSAMKAVIKANPLPQIPEGLTKGILEIGVRFIPE